jgi:hypothetical protein
MVRGRLGWEGGCKKPVSWPVNGTLCPWAWFSEASKWNLDFWREEALHPKYFLLQKCTTLAKLMWFKLLWRVLQRSKIKPTWELVLKQTFDRKYEGSLGWGGFYDLLYGPFEPTWASSRWRQSFHPPTKQSSYPQSWLPLLLYTPPILNPLPPLPPQPPSPQKHHSYTGYYKMLFENQVIML